MNLLSIQYFLAIVEEGNISAAARKLFISQQTLSEHVKKMEAEMGTPLFKRGKALTLTLAGECFFTNGRELINVYDSMLADIDSIAQNRRSRITVAIPTYATPIALTDIIASYRQKYPQYEVAVVKRQHNDIVHNMTGVDLYLSWLPLSPGLENVTLIENDPYCVTFSRPLAERIYGGQWEALEEKLIQTRDLSLLKEMPFLMQRDRYGQISEDMRLVFDEYHFMPTVAINSESSGMNEGFCQKGIGCLLAAESHVVHRFLHGDSIPDQDLLCYPIRVTSFETKLAISYEKGRHLHPAESSFIKEAIAYYDHENRQLLPLPDSVPEG